MLVKVLIAMVIIKSPVFWLPCYLLVDENRKVSLCYDGDGIVIFPFSSRMVINMHKGQM